MPNPTMVAAYFDDKKITDAVSGWNLVSAFGQHQVGQLDIKYGPSGSTGTSVRPVLYDDWTNVQIIFGNPVNGLATWYGYVHHSKTTSDLHTSGVTVVSYVVVGTSLPMDDENTRSWKSTSASSIVRQIFTAHRLRSVTSVHPRVFDYWAQPGNSDFLLLKGLANETGYRLYVDGATGYFFDPRVLLDSPSARSTQTFVQNRDHSGYDNLLKFEILTGRMVPRDSGSTRRQVVTGLDQSSGKVVTATTALPDAKVSLSSVAVGRSINRMSEAIYTAQAAALSTRNWITASATVFGDATIRPGMIVNLDGDALPSNCGGLWMVKGTEHQIVFTQDSDTPNFLTVLSLERDQKYTTTIDTTVSPTNTQALIPATIRDGIHWEASVLEDIRVS